jgi:general nucleoside transport system ATP-binding protein
MNTPPFQLELRAISKTFGRLHANDNISFSLSAGRIYAILGENGAGKSTLMKILSGYQPADSGQLLINGQAVTFRTPADALAAGIGMLHQDPLDIGPLSVLDNFLLGQPRAIAGNNPFPKRGEARAALLKSANALGFTINPDAYVDSLTIGERQQLEMARLAAYGARVLILDEPTTGISAGQKEALFAALRNLARQQGAIVILVSHKLEDVEALCDEVFVLRAGKLIGNRQMPATAADLVALMFGQAPPADPRPAQSMGEAVLVAKTVDIAARRFKLRALSLTLRAGEVVGLAGLDGSGQREFLQACASLRPIAAGQLSLLGQPIRAGQYRRLRGQGLAYVPAGRLDEGLVAGLSIDEHFALTQAGRGLGIGWRAAKTRAAAQIDTYHIRGSGQSQVQTLSGGNQQRTLIALLPDQLRLLLLEEPTRGLDVESTHLVWQQLLARRQQGTAIMFISSDLEEIITYADRVLVFFDGQALLVDDRTQMTNANLGQLIGGKGY